MERMILKAKRPLTKYQKYIYGLGYRLGCENGLDSLIEELKDVTWSDHKGDSCVDLEDIKRIVKKLKQQNE